MANVVVHQSLAAVRQQQLETQTHVPVNCEGGVATTTVVVLQVQAGDLYAFCTIGRFQGRFQGRASA